MRPKGAPPRIFGTVFTKLASIVRDRALGPTALGSRTAPFVWGMAAQAPWRLGLMLPFLVLAGGTLRAGAQSPPADVAAPDGRPPVVVTPEGRIELHLTNVPLGTVLELLSRESRRNIIASPEVKGVVTANLFEVSFEEALEAVLAPNKASYRKAGNFVYVYTLDELKAMADATTERPVTRVFHLNYVSAADAQTYLLPLLGKAGTVSVSPPAAAGL